MTKPVYHDGKVHVCARPCSTCVFHPGNRMHLRSGRLREMVDESLAQNAAITCHKTLEIAGAEQSAVCRGFYDRHADDVTTLKAARHLGVIEEIEPDCQEDEPEAD